MLLECPERSCLLLYVSALIHENFRQPNPKKTAEKIFFSRKIL